MPIKKDGSGKRWVEMELFVPGTPEQVWQALATGSGNAGWFLRAEIEPRVGGTLRFHFGEGVTTSGEVTMWEPPHQFGYIEREWEAGAPPVATEITITARSGDKCVVRMVHSLFASSDDWDDQLEGFESGWPGFFEVLRVYLKHFSGQSASSFMTTHPTKIDSITAWTRLGERLGLSGANVGERRSSPPVPEPVESPEALSGIVEHVHQDASQRYVLLRLESPSPGIALIGTHERSGVVSPGICRYFYGSDTADAARAAEMAWKEWLKATFDSK